MFQYIVRRLLFSLPIFLIASVVVFWVVRETASPEAVLRTNPRVNAEALQRYREATGLDKPAHQQYVTWAKGFVTGDWGDSIVKRRGVWDIIRPALWNTFVLGAVAVALSLLIGMAIGVFSAVRQYSPLDHVFTGGAFVGLSIPNFWFALILQILFGLYLVDWFNLDEPIFFIAGMTSPGTQGFDLMDRIRHLALPVMVLAVQIIAIYSRYMRASMLDVMSSDYLRTARAKGLPEHTVITRHGMRNAMIPLTTQVAIDVGLLTGGLIITEEIFQWPGMGALFLESFRRGDYMVVLPWLMIVVGAVILFNLIADILYAVLDPRIRYG